MTIEHDQVKHEFVAEIGPYRGILMYAQSGKVLDFYHIYIPDPFRNQGLAAKILIAAFEYAEKESFQIVPTCPFVANDFLPRFPQYQKLVKAGEFPFASRSDHSSKRTGPNTAHLF